jgi:hypothetical protein
MKIAVLVPSTSRNRTWKEADDSYLNMLFKTFKETADSEHEYMFFVGVDDNDEYYIRHKSAFEKEDIRIVPVRVERGYVTHIWNALAKIAYDDGFDYMFQCGDDVRLDTPGWINKSIEILKATNNVGVTGPNDRNNKRLLTQTVVHRTHYETFGFYFPPEIPNWFCDDWINEVYVPVQRLPENYTCFNGGGEPRYNIVHCRDLCTRLVRRDRKILDNILLGLHQ